MGVEQVVDLADHHHRASHTQDAYRWALLGAEAAGRAGGATEMLRLLRRALDLWPQVPDPGLSKIEARNVSTVAAVAGELADTVAAAFADGHDILVLGGDCTIELGTVAGAIRDGARVGLAYVDLDSDLNVPGTGEGALDWMGVAHLLDVAGAHETLTSLAGRRPMLDVEAVRLFAVENVTTFERSVIDRLGLHVEPLADVVDDPDAVAERTRAWAASYDRILVHVDIDVLDYTKFPIAHEIRDSPGLELPQLARLLRDLHGLPNWSALTLSEVNPDHAPDERDSFGRLIEMLGDVLGGSD